MWFWRKQKKFDPDGELTQLFARHQQAMEAGRLQEAEQTVYRLFDWATKWSEQNPSLDGDLTEKGDDCLEQGDWNGAEIAFRAVLALPDPNPMWRCASHGKLCRLFRLLDRSAHALEQANLATAEARQADSEFLLASSLQGLARCYLDSGEIELAQGSVAEALAVLTQDRLYDQMRARAWILRAEIALLSGQLDAIDVDLKRAKATLDPASGISIAAGVHSDLGLWWSVTARTRAASGDPEGAISAWQNAVSAGKHVASLPHAQDVYTHVTMAFMLAGLIAALEADGRSTDAEHIRAEREALVHRLPAGIVYRQPRGPQRSCNS